MRMRFTKAEKAAFTPGTVVEVRNGRYWYPAKVTGELVIRDGWHEIRCEVTSTAGRNGSVRRGDTWSAGPTSIRLPQPA